MGRKGKNFVLGLAVASALVLAGSAALAYPTGITGVTNKSGGSGCGGCHSGSSLSIVTISGPAALQVGQTGTYTLTINSGTLIGCDIAASSGTLTPVTSGLRSLNSELTHSSMLSGTSVTFTYTPNATGSQTLYATGARTSKSGGWGHAPNFAVNVTSSGTTDVAEGTAPMTFALHQNFPNPFNPTTTIQYDLPKNATVTLTVYNLLGEQIGTLVRGLQAAGSHQVRFDGAMLPTGAYIYRLEARPENGGASFVETRKFVLLR